MKEQIRPSIANRWRLREIKKQTQKILALEKTYRHYSDETLQTKSLELRNRHQAGESLDDLLVEAFALVRETCYRILGKFPYPVQLMGAIALHQGAVAEMRTGEGKTLTATLALYLNALSGKGTLLVTPNGYLAKRDMEEMAPLYHFLGLSTGLGVYDEDEDVSVETKRDVYASDVVYTTSSILGFDYLTHHLSSSLSDQFMRSFHYAIIDEADAILLDNAQTPLVISGAPRVQSNLFDICNQFVLTLEEGQDFYLNKEKKEVYLKTSGIDEAERFFAISDLYDNAYWEINRHINLALRAHTLYRKNIDYLVQEDEVILLDQQTGRTLEGMRMQSGIHQALETKEKVKKTKESRAMGSITYQSLFNQFPKLSGMTGTASMSEDELLRTYHLPVVTIPTNQPIRRKDYPDKIYASLPEKLYATLDLIKTLHATGQPILLISGTVEITEIYSKLLLQEGIAHNTLTAYNVAKEALIIQEAGQKGAVTCATILAGRGTDIKLGEGVSELGGLAVIGTERMANRRMDWQLRGRSGRQGQVGMSQFFVSLEDDLLTSYGPDWVKKYFKKYGDGSSGLLKGRRFYRAIEHAQEKSEEQGEKARQTTIQYDEPMRIQRNKIYRLRQDLLSASTNLSEKINQIAEAVIDRYLEDNPRRDEAAVKRYILDAYSYRFKSFPEELDITKDEALRSFLLALVQDELKQKQALLSTEEATEEFYRLSVLKAIDQCWIQEVDSLQQLKGVVSMRGIAQRDGMYEYYKEALTSYQKMTAVIQEQVLQNLMLSTIERDSSGKQSIYFV